MRRLTSSIFAVLAVAATVVPASAVPPAAGGALGSANVDLVATIPDVGAVGGRILGDTMYVTGTSGLRIYDLGLGVPVPMGALALPHFENEDVDTNGEILLISADGGLGIPGVYLYVVDVRNKNLPTLLAGPIEVPDGHIASCINGCTYAWLTGSRAVQVIDLTDPANPVVAGSFNVPAGGTHDVQVDEAGIAWVTGGGGIWGYTTDDPLRPVLVASQRRSDPNPFHNDFILHNSWRPDAAEATPAAMADGHIDPGEVLLVTEENWLAAQNGMCSNDGQFQTGWYRTVNGKPVIETLDAFSLGWMTVSDQQKPTAAVACSAHYFSESDGIVALAYYEQGVRFLDVSDPRTIRQIGYFMPAVTETWSVLMHGEYLYTLDIARGIDVLRFTGEAGDPEVVSPSLRPTTNEFSVSSATWGTACRIPVVA